MLPANRKEIPGIFIKTGNGSPERKSLITQDWNLVRVSLDTSWNFRFPQQPRAFLSPFLLSVIIEKSDAGIRGLNRKKLKSMTVMT